VHSFPGYPRFYKSLNSTAGPMGASNRRGNESTSKLCPGSRGSGKGDGLGREFVPRVSLSANGSQPVDGLLCCSN
jgi:hypothetical protein